MDNYLNSYREMISLRGLTHHTVTSYSTYISAYLDYLSVFLCKDPQDVSWQELRDFIRRLQKARSLSYRTMNAVISQLRFFTIYVLHKTWDDSQLPRRRFDESLKNDEFIRRFLMHVLPHGFQRIRYYGFLNNRMKSKNLKLIFKLQGYQRFKRRYQDLSIAELLKAVWNFDIRVCPECGCMNMKHLGRVYAKPR